MSDRSDPRAPATQPQFTLRCLWLALSGLCAAAALIHNGWITSSHWTPQPILMLVAGTTLCGATVGWLIGHMMGMSGNRSWGAWWGLALGAAVGLFTGLNGILALAIRVLRAS